MTKIYVTMTDKFMSGWGKAQSKINKLVLECDTLAEAKIVCDNANSRTEMRSVSICSNKPRYDPSRYLVSWHDKTDYSNWYKRDGFK